VPLSVYFFSKIPGHMLVLRQERAWVGLR